MHPAKAATVTSYGGQADQIVGTTVAKLAIQSYTSTMQFLVLKMDKSIDCILGEPWHKANRAVHQYTARGLDTVALTNGRSRRKLTQPKAPEVSPRVNRLVSAAKFIKATRKSGMGREYFVAYVSLTSETGGG